MSSSCFNWMWMFPLFPIIMMLVCLSVAWLIFGRGRFTSSCCGSGSYLPSHRNAESAMDILKKRYASGEIGKDEFERMKKEILS
ncbi:MAG: SHOCT domain-containing protein [Kiritimatiellaeota bacterium]|nr:SHOCT domain-containing protein [Kiritimatiellota bacterium]